VTHAHTSSSETVTHEERERSIFVGFLVAVCLLVPCAVAAYVARSMTLGVDLLISLAETLASLLSWIIVRKVRRGRNYTFNYGFGKLENISGLGVAAVMLASFMVVVIEGINRLREPVATVEAGVLLGLAITAFAAASDTWLWMKNLRLARRQPSPLMEAQWRFFRSKSVCDYAVLTSLGLTLLLHEHSWSVYIDTVFSFGLSGFLLWSAYMITADSIYDLLDRALDESLQFEITRFLAVHFEAYDGLHGVRTRRSGDQVYIEIYLEFAGGKLMADVQQVIDTLTADLEARIRNSHVAIVPRTTAVI
jgi:cation diffusion facilitator family transporter